MGRKLKKRGLFILISTLITMTTLPVMATEPPSSSLPSYLSIETKMEYENMKRSYQSGYEPTVEDGKVILVLPLQVEKGKKIDDNKLAGSIKVSSETTVPFTMRSYEKEFKLKKVKTSRNKNQELYLVTFALQLKSDRINGSYPITIQTKYQVDGQELIQDFELYINIKDGEYSSQTSDLDAKVSQGNLDSLNSEDLDSSVAIGGEMGQETQTGSQESADAPKLMVTGCTIYPEKPKAGEEITFELVLENKSSKGEMKNIKLTYGSEQGELIPEGTQNSIFLNSISANGSQVVTFKMKVADVITGANQKIVLDAQYEDKSNQSYTATESLYVKVDQPFSVFVDKAVLNATVESGKKVDVTVKIFNTGKVAVKNAKCSLDVDGLTDGGATFIGDIEPGAFAQGTISAAVTQKLLGKEGITEEEKYGMTQGNLTVTYEDLSGTSYQEERSVRTKINKTSGDNEIDKKIERSSQWSVSLVVGMAFIYIMSGVGFLVWKKRQP